MVISDDMPSVSGDMVRLRQVMTNLLENAVKFMGGQKEPRVEVGNRNDAGETVFFVRDNGIGIKKENLQKVFGLFERFNPEIPGTGVGLATVKRIIEAHGGKIWTESEGEGKGTTVCFTLTVVPELSPAIKIIMGK
jgi:signal transduction histidine kinase